MSAALRSGWSVGKVNNSNFIFKNCDKLVGEKGTVYSDAHIDKTYAKIDGGTNDPGYLSGPPVYTVTWENYDGTELKTEQFPYGTTPVYGDDPVRPAERQTRYTFKGWDPAPAPITSDMEYIALYNELTPKTITVNPTVHGEIAAPATAYADDTVTLTVSPEEMYQVISVTVNGEEIITDEGVYSFVMPDENVTIAATFDFGTKLAGHSISLDGDIGVNFYMELNADIAASDTAYMHFTIPKNGEHETVDVKVKQAKKVESDGKT